MLQIGRRAYETMIAHLVAVFPAEGCGFLAGRAGQISLVYPIDNTKNSPTAYRMDPRQQVEALLAIEDAGLTLLGIYHSHPGGAAVLSPEDLDQAAFYDVVYLVAALEEGKVQPWLREIRGYTINKPAAAENSSKSIRYEVQLKIE